MVLRKHTLFIFHYALIWWRSWRYYVALFWRWVIKPCQTACSELLSGIYKNTFRTEVCEANLASYLKLCQQTNRLGWKIPLVELGQSLLSLITDLPKNVLLKIYWKTGWNHLHPCNVLCLRTYSHSPSGPGRWFGRGSRRTGQHKERGKAKQGRRKSQKKPSEVFESSGIPLLLRGSSGRRQEPVERAR